MFTTAEVSPTEMSPNLAARRPVGPAVTARAAAAAIDSLEWFAAREISRIALSSEGVGVLATAE